MSFKQILLATTVLLLGFSCTTQKNTILWVSGTKTECSAGAGKMMCLQVHRGEDLSAAKWENFYAPIEGFSFEEGYLKKIEVREEQLQNVPADASSIKYTLIKELERQLDYHSVLNGAWVLARINDQPINRSVPLPTLDIDLAEMHVSGNGGCNGYGGPIAVLDASSIQFGNLISTEMACMNANIENEYYQALNAVRSFQIKGDFFTCFNAEGEKILAFIKKSSSPPADAETGNWQATHIFGEAIATQTTTPNLSLDFDQKEVSGSDGCNNFRGAIERIAGSEIKFGTLASTKKLCPDMTVPDQFNKAMNQVAGYEVQENRLVFSDSAGREVLAFALAK